MARRTEPEKTEERRKKGSSTGMLFGRHMNALSAARQRVARAESRLEEAEAAKAAAEKSAAAELTDEQLDSLTKLIA
jgi:hypothetical protein